MKYCHSLAEAEASNNTSSTPLCITCVYNITDHGYILSCKRTRREEEDDGDVGETNVVVEEEVTAQKVKTTTKKWKMEMKIQMNKRPLGLF